MNQRPNLSYQELIKLALLSKPEGKATVCEIYDFIEMTFPYYQTAPECRFWKNSIRHTLCKNRHFLKTEAVHTDDGKPYKRGKAVWEFCSDGTRDHKTSPLPSPVPKTISQVIHTGARPGSVDSACTDEWNTGSLYPWQPNQTENNPFDVGTSPATTSIAAEETPAHPSKLSFFTPWTTSPDKFPTSHLEAPHFDESRTPPPDSPIDHPPQYSTWLHGQDYPSSGGCVTSPLAVGGAWTDPASEAVRSASPLSLLANSPLPLAMYPSQLTAPSQYIYPDGNFWYLPPPVPHSYTNLGHCYERQLDVLKEPN